MGMTDALPPADRVVMISGGARGIGAALARRLLNDGFRLSLGVRDLDAVPNDILSHGPERAAAFRFDALEPGTAADWVDATLHRFGAIDVLINNAGILKAISFEDGDEDILDQMFAVNVKAAFRMIRLTLPHLRSSGTGRIVNVASTDARRYRDASVSIGYALTKHALLAVSHAAKFAGWEDGVRVTALCPGAVDTELLQGIPGAMPISSRLQPETLGDVVAMLLSLPNVASVPELVINTRLESTL